MTNIIFRVSKRERKEINKLITKEESKYVLIISETKNQCAISNDVNDILTLVTIILCLSVVKNFSRQHVQSLFSFSDNI